MWFKKYWLKENPFTIQPKSEIFVGFEEIKRRVFEAVESNDIILITGPFGSGKTALLFWLKNFLNYGGYTPVYLDCADFQLTKDVKELYEKINSYLEGGFLERLKNVLIGEKRKVVFLIDEADYIPKNFFEILKADKDRGFIYSIVFSSVDDKLSNLPKSMSHRIVEYISLRPMSFEEAVEMIEKRIEKAGGKNFFDIDALRYVCEISNWLPRDILKNCEKVAKELAYEKRESLLIKKEDVMKVLKIEE